MKKDARYGTRPGAGATMTADTVVASSGTVGRVWALSVFATTAAVATVVVRSGVTAGGTQIWSMTTAATIGDGGSCVFPNGLTFSNGLFVDVTAGAPQVSICYALDERADV